MDGEKGGAVKVIPIFEGCYLHVRHERLLGDQRKTANAFRTGWVTNTLNGTPSDLPRRRRDDAREKLLQIGEFARLSLRPRLGRDER